MLITLGLAVYRTCFWGIGGSREASAYFFCKWTILTADELLAPILVAAEDEGNQI